MEIKSVKKIKSVKEIKSVGICKCSTDGKIRTEKKCVLISIKYDINGNKIR